VFLLTHTCAPGHNIANALNYPVPIMAIFCYLAWDLLYLFVYINWVVELLKLEVATVMASPRKFAVYVSYFYFT
jgi:hypothetical protein